MTQQTNPQPSEELREKIREALLQNMTLLSYEGSLDAIAELINQEVQKALSMVEEPGIISFPFPMTTDEYKKMCEVIKWYKASINKIKEQYK